MPAPGKSPGQGSQVPTTDSNCMLTEPMLQFSRPSTILMHATTVKHFLGTVECLRGLSWYRDNVHLETRKLKTDLVTAMVPIE